MLNLSHSEIGKIIRKARMEQGLRLADLADSHISVSTISNIERGVSNVKMKKIYYILQKLKLHNKIEQRVAIEKQDVKMINIRLLGVESLLTSDNWKEALRVLDNLNLDETHPLANYFFYLKGKCLIKADNRMAASHHLNKAIKITEKKGDRSNIKAASYNEISVIEYIKCELDKALESIEAGINAFQTDGERKYVWWILQLNKALYLEKSGKLANSMNVVLEVWKSIETIDDMGTILKFYWLRAELLRRMEQLDDSEQFALKGIDIARRSGHLDELLQLWTVLGTGYINNERWDDAEFALKEALSIQGAKEHNYATAHAWIGRLYTLSRKWDMAFPHLKKAVFIAEKYNDIRQMIRPLRYLGEYHKERGEWELSVRCYERVWELSKRHYLRKQEYLALFRLAECWVGRDERKFQRTMMEMFEVQRRLATGEKSQVHDD